MAQFAVLIYANDSAHGSGGDTTEHTRHADELTASGTLLAAYALTSRQAATSIRADGVTDGPFLEAKEAIAGFYVIEAPDRDAAIAIAGRNPVIADGGGVEVRPVAGGGPVRA